MRPSAKLSLTNEFSSHLDDHLVEETTEDDGQQNHHLFSHKLWNKTASTLTDYGENIFLTSVLKNGENNYSVKNFVSVLLLAESCSGVMVKVVRPPLRWYARGSIAGVDRSHIFMV